MNELPPLADLHAALDPDERWRRYCESLHPRCIYAESSGPPCAGEVAERYNPLSNALEMYLVCELHHEETADLAAQQWADYYAGVL